MDHFESIPVVVYTPESQLLRPSKLLFAMGQDLKASRELAWRLAVRDIAAKYRQTTLGLLWAFLPPILSGLIFILLQSQNIVNFGETDVPYPVFVLIGTTLWQLFADSLNAPLDVVNRSKPMLAKINFPREALIISAIYIVLFNLLMKSLVLFGILLFFQVPLTWGTLFAPVVIFMFILFGIMIGLFLVPVGSLYTDVTTALPFIIQLWFFVTPVIYPMPQTTSSHLFALVNPASIFLVSARDLLTNGTISNFWLLFVYSVLTIIALFVAWLIYRVALPIIIERMSA